MKEKTLIKISIKPDGVYAFEINCKDKEIPGVVSIMEGMVREMKTWVDGILFPEEGPPIEKETRYIG